jgi:branched-chain amino acid aminotransferase
LKTSAAMINLPMPLSDTEWLERVEETMRAAGGTEEAYVRLILTRGVGDLTYDPAATSTPTVVVIVKPLTVPPPESYDRGVPIILASVVRNHPHAIDPRIKSNNLLNNALAMQEALRHGVTEALLKNYRGELAECAQSNFFIVRGGEALTPGLEAGLLEGVTRDVLLAIGPTVGVPVREAVLREEDLPSADEAFITSTTREVLPVVRVGPYVIGSGHPGSVTRRLQEAFLNQVRATMHA